MFSILNYTVVHMQTTIFATCSTLLVFYLYIQYTYRCSIQYKIYVLHYNIKKNELKKEELILTGMQSKKNKKLDPKEQFTANKLQLKLSNP